MESMSSSGAESLLYNDYKLALKHFINKDFEKSFVITSKVHAAALRSFELGQIREKPFIRIVSLYLTEIGILLPAHSTVVAHDRSAIVEDLKNDLLLRKLHDMYGNTASIPAELLYQIFLVYYTCRGLLGGLVLDKFKLTYHNLEAETDLHTENVYLQRWTELFLFNVLPDAGDFDTARAIASSMPDPSSAKAKLTQIEARKADEAAMAGESSKKAKKAEAERVAVQKAREQKEAQEKNLKYMSMKQIRKSHEEVEKAPKETNHALLQRAQYYYELAKSSIGPNSPMILLVIVCFFVASKFLRTRKYNLKEKFKETMAMAFKVTYL